MAGAGAGPAALSEGERRQVSVLFADLSGHTRLTEELDAEELHELMLGFFRAVDRSSRDLRRHGGRAHRRLRHGGLRRARGA